MHVRNMLTLILKARGGGDMSSSGFASRAQSAGDQNSNANSNQSKGTSK